MFDDPNAPSREGDEADPLTDADGDPLTPEAVARAKLEAEQMSKAHLHGAAE